MQVIHMMAGFQWRYVFYHIVIEESNCFHTTFNNCIQEALSQEGIPYEAELYIVYVSQIRTRVTFIGSYGNLINDRFQDDIGYDFVSGSKG